MKAVLGLVCGFVLTLAVFSSGLGFAAWLLAKPPRQATATVSVAELWTRKARPVNKAGQGLERLPAAQSAPPDIPAKPQETPPDPTVTGAIAPKAADLPPPHLAWCASRYRSYHPDDNSYLSYSGQLRRCVSPYLEAAGQAGQAAQPAAGDGDENGAGLGVYVADEGGAALSADHVDSCFSRYRSYRPEDNSYQPYSGGPRRQCQ